MGPVGPDIYAETVGVSKAFGGVQALSDVSVAFRRAEVHALVGENGAGKSTLGKIVAGIHRPTSGEVLVGGEEKEIRTPREALALGIAMMHQEVAVAPQLSVLENVFLGRESALPAPTARGARRARLAELQEFVGAELDPEAEAGRLRIPEQQQVELMRVLARGAEMIVLDEPTASLTRSESDRFLEIVRRLSGQGTTVIFVSHALEEVLAVADRVTVMRGGRVVKSGAAAAETKESLIAAMLGAAREQLSDPVAPVPADAPVRLEVRGVSTASGVKYASLEIRAGEIVGMAGIVGSGRTELARAIAGVDPMLSGEVSLDGEQMHLRNARAGVRSGIAYIPESRKDALLIFRSVAENLTLSRLTEISSRGVINRGRERAMSSDLIERLDVRPDNPAAAVTALSGGNQQKVLFGKWLATQPRVVLADEPTRGVDIGARAGIYDLLRELSAQGIAILLISSETEEVLALAHRILVMRAGRIVADLASDEMSEEAVLRHALVGSEATIAGEEAS